MSGTEMIIVAFAAVIVFIIALYCGIRISNFRDELNYINAEINRTVGSERIHWQHEKKRLWLSLIPYYCR